MLFESLFELSDIGWWWISVF